MHVLFERAYRHEKMCNPAILDCGQILGEMQTFFAQNIASFFINNFHLKCDYYGNYYDPIYIAKEWF